MNDLFPDKKDYTYLNWSKIRSSSGTAGSFLKATEIKNGKKIYYKLSNYDSVEGITGHECINEIIVSRLMNILDIPHLQYRLLYGTVQIDEKKYDTYFCASDSFRNDGERKISFEDYYQLKRHENETPAAFMQRNGWEIFLNQMIVVDYLIQNRDRHGANIELLRKGDGKVCMAPLFDQGISLLFQCATPKEAEAFDVMKDRRVQSFLGTNSVEQNLSFMTQKAKIQRLEKSHREVLFKGLENILPEIFYEKIWEMIEKRWKHYESLFNL